MSGSVNKVILVGVLGRDPEMRRLNSGSPVVNFSMAMNETWRDKASGERRERVEWINVVIFNEGLAEVANQFLKKGSRCYVEGKLHTRKFTDKDGNERQTTEVVLQQFQGALVLLGDPRANGDGSRNDDRASDNRDRMRRESPQRPLGNEGGGFRGQRGPIDDDIPF